MVELTVVVGVMLRVRSLAWSIALCLASCLVIKGVGVDRVQDSLTVLVFKIRCRCQKKSERPVDNTGLNTTDRTNASSLHKVKLESNEGLRKKENYIQKGSCQRSVIEVVCSYI